MNEIRVALGSLGLMTDPDFESARIDALIRIRLKNANSVNSGVLTVETPERAKGNEEGEMAEARSSREEKVGTREDWIFPLAEGVCVDNKNGRWSDGAFFADLMGDEDIPIEWFPAEPASHVQDREVWRRWLKFLETSPSAAETLLMVAKSRARVSQLLDDREWGEDNLS